MSFRASARRAFPCLLYTSNSNGYIASVRFRADSEVNYYCPRLSTAWNNEDYTEYFNNRDAYLYDFVGNPKLPCTSVSYTHLSASFIFSSRPTA